MGPLLLSVLLAVAAAPPAVAASIEVLSASRTVAADALSATGAEFSAQTRADGQEPGDPEGTSLGVVASAQTRGSEAVGDASQQSSFGAAALVGSGRAEALSEILLPAEDPDAGGTASSLLQVGFRVDESFAYRIEGILRAAALGLADAFAALQLTETGTDFALFEAEATPDTPLGMNAFDGTVDLEVGVEYELLVLADGVADLDGSGTASFEFSLRPVPEPGTSFALALGLAALVVARRSAR